MRAASSVFGRSFRISDAVGLHSRQFTDNKGITKSATEIVIDDMQMLDKKPQEEEVTAHTNGQQAATQ
jgi:single-stranded DNA-binding protein